MSNDVDYLERRIVDALTTEIDGKLPTVKAVAKALNCTQKAVQYVRRVNGLVEKKMWHYDDDDIRAAAFFREQKSEQFIMAELGRDESSVKSFSSKFGRAEASWNNGDRSYKELKKSELSKVSIERIYGVRKDAPIKLGLVGQDLFAGMVDSPTEEEEEPEEREEEREEEPEEREVEPEELVSTIVLSGNGSAFVSDVADEILEIAGKVHLSHRAEEISQLLERRINNFARGLRATVLDLLLKSYKS